MSEYSRSETRDASMGDLRSPTTSLTGRPLRRGQCENGRRRGHRASKRFATDIRLPGYITGGNLTTYMQSRNIGAPTVDNYDLPLTGQPGACALPTLPP